MELNLTNDSLETRNIITGTRIHNTVKRLAKPTHNKRIRRIMMT